VVSLRRRLLAGGFWVLVGKLATVVSTLATHGLLARLLEPEVYGVFVIAFSLVTVAAMVARLGLQFAIVRLIAESLGVGDERRARGAIFTTYRLALAGTAAVAGVLWFGGGRLAVGMWDSPRLAAAMGAVSAWVAVTSFQVLNSETLRGFKDLRNATLFGGVVVGLANILALGLWRWSGRPLLLTQVIWLHVATTGLSVAQGAWAVRLRTVRLAPGRIRAGEVAGIAFPMWITALTQHALAESAVWILAVYAAKEGVAVYGAAARVVNVVSMPLILVNLVVPPYIAEMYSRGDRERLQRILRQTATLAGVPAVVVLLGLVIFGEPLLGLAFGDYYRAGALVLAILSAGKLVNVATGSCGVTMSMTGHQRVLMWITLATTVLTMAICVALAPGKGATGVALAVSAGTVVQNIVLWLATRHYTGLWTHCALPRRSDLQALLVRGGP